MERKNKLARPSDKARYNKRRPSKWFFRETPKDLAIIQAPLSQKETLSVQKQVKTIREETKRNNETYTIEDHMGKSNMGKVLSTLKAGKKIKLRG